MITSPDMLGMPGTPPVMCAASFTKSMSPYAELPLSAMGMEV